MMIAPGLVAVVVAALASGQSSAAPSQTASPSSPVALEMGVHLMRERQQTNTATIGSGDHVAGYVWTDVGLCSAGAGGTVASTGERIGWRVAGHIVERAGADVVIEAEWQRVGTSGAPEGTTSTRRFTIAPGSSVMLDEVAPAAASPCLTTMARLEAAIVVPGASRAVIGGGGFGGGGGRAGGYGAGGPGASSSGGGLGRGIGAGGSGGSGGRGRGGAGPTGSGAGVGAGSGSGAGGFGGAGGGVGAGAAGGGGGAGAGGLGAAAGAGSGAAGGRGRGSGPTAAVIARMLGDGSNVAASTLSPEARAAAGTIAPGPDTRVTLAPMPGLEFDADVWLVHTPANGVEQSQKISNRVTTEGQVFAFPQLVIPTARGSANVDVAVMLGPRVMEGGTPVLRVVVTRVFSGSANSLGSTTKVILLPAPADIVSFEIPPADGRGVPAVTGDQFSVRIKLTPRKPD